MELKVVRTGSKETNEGECSHVSFKCLNKTLGAVFTLVFFLISPLELSAKQDILKVGSQTVDEQDYIYVLSRMTGDNLGVAALAFDSLSSTEKGVLDKHIEEVLLLAEESKSKGLALSPSVARQIKWDRVNTLAEAYVNDVSSRWDLSENKLKSYYKMHAGRYMSPVRALVRIQKCSGYSSARRVLNGNWSERTSRWVNYRNIPAEVSSVIFTAGSLGRLSPIKTFDGIYAVEVLRYEGQAKAPFSLVKGRVIKDLQKEYLSIELKKLKHKKTG